MTMHQHDEVVRVFQALSEPARLSMVHLLAAGEQRVVDLTGQLALAQSTVSAHLAVLREAGLVVARPDGRSTWYALAHPGLDHLLEAAEVLVGDAVPGDAGRVGDRAADAAPGDPVMDDALLGDAVRGDAVMGTAGMAR